MKLLTTDFFTKLALSMLLAIHIPAAIAVHNGLATKERSAQEQDRLTREEIRPVDVKQQRHELKNEQNNQQTSRKTGGYVSIISVIVNDALGSARKDMRTRKPNAAGKISF